MIALSSRTSVPPRTSPRDVWRSPSRRLGASVHGRSVALAAGVTAVGVVLMGAAPRAERTDVPDPIRERPAVAKSAMRLSGGAAPEAPVSGSGPAAADPLSPARLFVAASSAPPTTFSAMAVEVPPGRFVPRPPDAGREWKEEEFSSLTVADGRTLVAGAVRIRLVGLDLPMPEQVCRTLDGRLEPCVTRAATQLELLTRWRRVTCHYRMEGADEAIGRCRIGTSDLTERMVKTGYAWRAAPPA